MRTRTMAAIAIVILIALAVAASFNVYLTFDRSDASVLWNASEAYLFIGIRHIGHEVNCFRFPWFFAKNYLGGIEDPDADRGSLVVIRATSSGIERHVLKIEYEPPGSPGQYTPRQGRIYTNYPALGGLCYWAGDHFEPATPEERRGFNGIDGLTKKDFDPGWSGHSFAVGPGDINDTFTIEVGNSFRLSLSDLAAKNGDRAFSIDLLRPGRAPERVWNRDLHWGRVSKAEYRHVFQDRE